MNSKDFIYAFLIWMGVILMAVICCALIPADEPEQVKSAVRVTLPDLKSEKPINHASHRNSQVRPEDKTDLESKKMETPQTQTDNSETGRNSLAQIEDSSSQTDTESEPDNFDDVTDLNGLDLPAFEAVFEKPEDVDTLIRRQLGSLWIIQNLPDSRQRAYLVNGTLSDPLGFKPISGSRMSKIVSERYIDLNDIDSPWRQIIILENRFQAEYGLQGSLSVHFHASPGLDKHIIAVIFEFLEKQNLNISDVVYVTGTIQPSGARSARFHPIRAVLKNPPANNKPDKPGGG